MAGKVSVVIPAHDEAAIIATTLTRLIDTDRDGRLEIVVVANGCHDDTARAAAVSPRVTVIEIPEASKVAALDAGDRAATAFPRAYVDADVEVTAPDLLLVADALHDPPFAGAPSMSVDTTGASWTVRAQYRVWDLTDYRRTAMLGSGIYVLSAAGRARFGSFPAVIADDGYVQRLFDTEERATVAGAAFRVRAPRTFREFVRRQARIVAGNEELDARFPELPRTGSGGSTAALTRAIVARPSLWLSAIPYLAARVVAGRAAKRARGAWSSQAWNRDESSRTTEPDGRAAANLPSGGIP